MQDKLQFEAMTAPSDLWVLPPPRFSRWFSHLDWYFNWQMCKGLAYAGLHLPSETYRVAEEYGVPVADSRGNGEGALLISCAGRAPAGRCLVLDGAGDLKSWLARIKDVAAGLNARQVRVFLPTGATLKETEKHWKKSDIEVQFSPDLETTT